MQEYDTLENMQHSPVKWADDDNQGESKASSSHPVSTIAFPSSNDAGKDFDNHTTSPRIDGNRFNTLPIRPSQATERNYRYSTVTATRPALQATGRNTSRTLSNETSPQSSECSSPEGKVASLGPMTLRQRSMKSLQGIASSWVPSAIRLPYDSENEASVKAKGKIVAEKRPVRLDRRRLQKAVSLAIEAAQASEHDERAWKQKKKKLARKQLLLEQEESKMQRRRFPSLPWKRPYSANEVETQSNALVAIKGRSSASSSDDDDNASSQGTKKAGLGEGETTDESEELDGEEEEEEDVLEDDFSVDLYISSLSYLLSALSPRDVDNVGDKHRDEMKRKLEEALKNLKRGDTSLPDTSERERMIQMRVERELAMMEQDYYQRRNQSPGISRAHRAVQASSQERSRKQSVAGYLTTSAIDLGLSVGAGALAAASRGVASLLPILTSDSRPSSPNATLQELPDEKVQDVTIYPTDEKASIVVKEDSPILTRSQWELTRTLAQSVASTMYNNLAAVAEQRRQDPNMMSREVALYDFEDPSSTVARQDDASDQLLIMAATLARNVKRSPLPSQVRALTSQVVSLIGALDERYSLSKRSADVALRKTGQALYYVRKNDLHVKALRAAWAIVEASVAAIEAYRDEEAWKGEVTVARSIELPKQ